MEVSSFRNSLRCCLLALAAGAWTLSAYADGTSALSDGDGDLCPIVKVNAERLPELNIPRAGHNMFYAGDELTVVGGTYHRLQAHSYGRILQGRPMASAANRIPPRQWPRCAFDVGKGIAGWRSQ